MKLSFFIGDMGIGGAERVISHLANHFSSLGWNVDIVVLLSNKVGYDLHNNIKIIDFSGKHNNYYKNLLYWICNIRKYLK